MVVMLNDYDAVKIPDVKMGYRFLIPMDSANDVVLADLATEINNYDGRIIYDGDLYYMTQGVQKHHDIINNSWYAILFARKGY